jgi:hypothetical protein
MKKRKRLTIEKKIELASESKRGASSSERSDLYEVSIRQVNLIIQKEREGTLAKSSPSKHYSFRTPEGDVEAYLGLAS